MLKCNSCIVFYPHSLCRFPFITTESFLSSSFYFSSYLQILSSTLVCYEAKKPSLCYESGTVLTTGICMLVFLVFWICLFCKWNFSEFCHEHRIIQWYYSSPSLMLKNKNMLMNFLVAEG